LPRQFFFSGEEFYTKIYYFMDLELKKTESELRIILFDAGDSISAYFNGKTKYKGIFVAGEIDKDKLDFLNTLNLPVCFIDFYSHEYKFDYLSIDSFNSGFYVADYLLQCGHREIGFVGSVKPSTVLDRYLGYVKALKRRGIEPDPDSLIDNDIEKLGDFSKVSLPKRLPTAFICHCDLAAQSLYNILRLSNAAVCADVSVISFDNTELCVKMDPKLSSCGADKRVIASRALSIMAMRLKSASGPQIIDIIYPDIHLRDSVKNINKDA